MTTCSVPYCKSTKRKTPGVSFHEFPSKEPRRSQWIQIIQNCDGCGNTWQPSDHSVICGLHFRPEEFKSNCKHFLLLPEAVPSVFKDNSKHSNAKTRKRRRVITRSSSPPASKLKETASKKRIRKEEKENDKKNASSEEKEAVSQFCQPNTNQETELNENQNVVKEIERETATIGCQTEILSIKLLRRYQDELRQAKNTASCLVKRLELLENEIKELIDEKKCAKT